MTASRIPTLFACALLGAAVLADGASAFDLTGTWEGRWTCQGFDGEKFKSGFSESVVRISQNGTTLAVNMDDGAYLYNGAAIFDGQSPETKGEVVLNQCGTDRLPLAGADAELLRARVKADVESGAGSLKGISILEGASKGVYLQTCKYSYKRVDTVNPAVPACP